MQENNIGGWLKIYHPDFWDKHFVRFVCVQFKSDHVVTNLNPAGKKGIVTACS